MKRWGKRIVRIALKRSVLYAGVVVRVSSAGRVFAKPSLPPVRHFPTL